MTKETKEITVQGENDYINECRENEIDDLRQVRDKLHRTFHDAALPSEEEIRKKVLMFFEREKYFFDNKLTESDSKAVLNDLDKLRDEIINYIKSKIKQG